MRPIHILLQTTIQTDAQNWHVGRFSLLREHLESLRGEDGAPLTRVTARDRRTPEDVDDPILSTIDTSDVDELWLFAVDSGSGLTQAECEAITSFRKRGGGILSARDHQDLGSSVCTIGGIGEAHYFHTKNPDPDPSRNRMDYPDAPFKWPNYNSGANGDYQIIEPQGDPHPLLARTEEHGRSISRFPAHPHEGSVGVPAGAAHARVVATGRSVSSGRDFNLVVAFDRHVDPVGVVWGRGLAHSSFHHLVDFNWNTGMGCPPFLTETPGTEIERDPSGLEDAKAYVRNAAIWLAPNR